MSGSSKKIAIIGAGQLGSRHLQGLTKINQAIDITVIEPNPDALNLAKNRYEEMPVNPLVRSVSYVSSLKSISQDLDLAIIATNANVRRKVIENLLGKTQVKYLILEKVVFQSIRDFEEVIQFLEEKCVKTWVNCARRITPFFLKLREKTIKAGKVQVIVKGRKWGMASTTIHMLDLLAFLTGQTEICVDGTRLDHKIYKSNRGGFLELGGKLLAQTVRGDILELTDERDKGKLFSKVIIKFDGQNIEVNQSSGYFRRYLQHPEDAKKKPYHMPLQSEITAKLAEQILDFGNSDLTTLDESYLLHRPMLDAFNEHLSKIYKKIITTCPIT